MDPALGSESRKNLWRNSAEWVASGECRLVVLTAVHDMLDRPGVPDTQMAYFDGRVDYRSEGATYSDDVNDDSGLVMYDPEIAGTMSPDGTTLTLYDPAGYDEAYLVEVLIHEVQHDADQHRPGEAFQPERPAGGTAPLAAYAGFQTEFRAYWFETPEGSQGDEWPSSSEPVREQLSLTARRPGPDRRYGTADDTQVHRVTRLQNARQEAIVRHLVGEPRPDGDWRSDEGWVHPYAYVPHYICLDPRFAEMVDDFARPVGGNALNSVRIQALSEAVAARDPARIAAACDALDDADRVYLDAPVMAAPFWSQVERELAGPGFSRDRARIVAAVTGREAPWSGDGGTYRVVAGDNLSRIAARTLGDAARAEEIAVVNPERVRDPDLIREGDDLRLPIP
ncbi:MAG: LysM peptidoglycan-binding domain-containing protein [bacterium]